MDTREGTGWRRLVPGVPAEAPAAQRTEAEPVGLGPNVALIANGVEMEGRGVIKVQPMVSWTFDQAWDYIRSHKIPYNPLHDRGLTTIDCAPCTAACGGPTDPDQTRYP